MRISDWSSDVCSSDLLLERNGKAVQHPAQTVVLDLLSHHLSRRPPKAHRLDFFDAVDLALHNIVGERNGTQEARKKSSKPIGKAHAIDVRRLRIAVLGTISGRIDRPAAALLLDQAHRGEDRTAPPAARARQDACRLDPLPGRQPLSSTPPGQGGKLLETPHTRTRQ